MQALSTLTNQTMIIPGKIVQRPRTPAQATGLTLLSTGNRARVKLGKRTLTLRNTRLITRPSGRKRHLSRFLVGIDVVTGRVVEIFIEAVKGVRETCFRLKEALRRGMVRLVARGLNLRQMIEIGSER